MEDNLDDKMLIYQKGKENLLNFIEQGHLVQDSECRMYVYGQKMSEGLGGHEQFGIVALSNIEDYAEGRIKKHELTTIEKEEDRTNLCDVQGANAGPVFLAFQGAEHI